MARVRSPQGFRRQFSEPNRGLVLFAGGVAEAVGRRVGAGRVAVNQITGLDVTDCARDRSARIRLD